MTRTARSAAIAALAALVAVAAIIAADFATTAQAQNDDETTGRIVARLLDDGRVEFGWQPTGGTRILPRQRYFPADARVDRWLRSSPIIVAGAAIGRINARLLENGRIEFAFTPSDGERIEPRSRYFPADARVGRWLRSTEITITPPAARYTAVSAGLYHTCAIHTNGEITCWGNNGVARFNEETQAIDRRRAGQADAPPGSFTTVSAGGHHTCAIRTNGEIACWGDNDYGQTDAPPGNYIAVSAGNWHTCAIRESGSITCWGNDGHHKKLNAPAGSYTAVSAGGAHTCAIRSTGAIECWGNDYAGISDAPVGHFTAVSAGLWHTCGLRSTGAFECWGDNGDEGIGTPTGSYTAVSAGGAHNCGLREDGEISCWEWIERTCVNADLSDRIGLHCWGSNDHGQTDAPPGTFTAADAGSAHTCAIRESDGAIKCWGANWFGEATPPAN